MKNVLLILAFLITLTLALWCAGCGSAESKTATPQQMEEYRQKNLQRATRMRQEGTKR